MFNQNQLKIKVAREVIQYIPHNKIIGIGTGSTINCLINELQYIKHKISGVVASSKNTEEQVQSMGIPIINLNDIDHLDLYIDGADEIDPNGSMIKGGGAALTREKIIAEMAQQFICIADSTKLVQQLGKFPLPIEVIPMATNQVIRQISKWGGQASLRMNSFNDKNALLTDNGNMIVDVIGLNYDNPSNWELRFNSIVGVVTVGLFARRPADISLISHANGITVNIYNK